MGRSRPLLCCPGGGCPHLPPVPQKGVPPVALPCKRSGGPVLWYSLLVLHTTWLLLLDVLPNFRPGRACYRRCTTPPLLGLAIGVGHNIPQDNSGLARHQGALMGLWRSHAMVIALHGIGAPLSPLPLDSWTATLSPIPLLCPPHRTGRCC
jgi:hypothetical protein